MVPFRPSEVVVDGTCYRIVSIYILKKDAIRYDQYIDYRRSPWNARLADGGREGGERGEGRGAERRGACRYVRVPWAAAGLPLSNWIYAFSYFPFCFASCSLSNGINSPTPPSDFRRVAQRSLQSRADARNRSGTPMLTGSRWSTLEEASSLARDAPFRRRFFIQGSPPSTTGRQLLRCQRGGRRGGGVIGRQVDRRCYTAVSLIVSERFVTRFLRARCMRLRKNGKIGESRNARASV